MVGTVGERLALWSVLLIAGAFVMALLILCDLLDWSTASRERLATR